MTLCDRCGTRPPWPNRAPGTSSYCRSCCSKTGERTRIEVDLDLLALLPIGPEMRAMLMTEPTSTAKVEAAAMRLSGLLSLTCEHTEPVADCLGCGVRDCPHSEPLHYDKDGCPACPMIT